MKMKFIAITITAALGLFNAVANAAEADNTAGTDTTTTPAKAKTTVNGGTVHFTGEFVNAACAVSTDSANQTVNLGQYTTSSITGTAQTTTKVPFTIKLNGCDTSIATTASIAFNGTLDSTDSALLAVNAGKDNVKAATGVGIEILDRESKSLKPDGSTYSAAQTLNNGSVTIPFAARYKSTGAVVTAGKADSDATFLIQYQ